MCVSCVPQRPAEGVRSPGAEITGSYELSDIDAENRTGNL